MPLSLQYIAPKNPLRAFFWRKRMTLEAMFGLTMLDPWEQILIVGLLFVFSSLFVTGVWKYLPTHVAWLRSRAEYYLEGR